MDANDPVAALLGGKSATNQKNKNAGRGSIAYEPRPEPSKEARIQALGVQVVKREPVDKEKRRREKEELLHARLSKQEQDKKARIDKEIEDVTAFLAVIKQQEPTPPPPDDAGYLLVRDGSEKPAVSETWQGQEALETVGADEARADQADAALAVSVYYAQDCMPVDAVVQLMTRNYRIPLEMCEFACFLPSGVMWRHRHFVDADKLRAWLIRFAPTRLEIGPWHTKLGSISTGGGISYATLPVERYWVQDLDMEDFSKDERQGYIRKCRCSTSKRVCSYGCWFYVRVAVKVLTYIMRKVLGATEVLPIYSGNRGVHLMCLDQCFVALSAEQRLADMARIALFASPDTYQHPEHTPYIYEFLLKEPFYNNFLDGQCLIRQVRDVTRMLLICARLDEPTQFPPACGGLLIELTTATGREARIDAWLRLCAEFGPGFEMTFIFKAMFPRLDERVTTGMDHCIKSVFAVHPSTKRVSVPIPDIDVWLPHMAPRLSEVIPLPADDTVPEWAMARVAQQRAMVLTPYIQHLQQVVTRAYPYQVRAASSMMMSAPSKSTKLY